MCLNLCFSAPKNTSSDSHSKSHRFNWRFGSLKKTSPVTVKPTETTIAQPTTTKPKKGSKTTKSKKGSRTTKSKKVSRSDKLTEEEAAAALMCVGVGFYCAF
jgi:hypothetical protein